LALVLVVALAGAVWSMNASESCFGCGEKGKLVGRLPLPLIGVAFYAVLVAVVAWGRLPRLGALGIQFAASAHVLFLGLLAWHELMCPPCILTGVAALAAAALLLVRAPWQWRSLLLVAPLTMLATVGVLEYSKHEATGYRMRVSSGYAEEAAERLGRPPRGRVRLFHWTRPGCQACAVYESKVLPWIRQKHPNVLEVSSDSLMEEGVPTPIVVVIGEQTVFFPMLPVPSELDRAVLIALGREAFDPADFTRGHLLDVDLPAQ
jgi:hypothetical protein